PAASIFFLISSASCLVTPSLMVLGAPSTNALASARPSPGTALRTSLITAILLAPISVRTTSKAVFSSAAGAAAPAAGPPAAGPTATATGAAALTPHFSSSCLTNPAISSTDRLLSCSTNLSVSAMLYLSSNCRLRKPSENQDRQPPTRSVFVLVTRTAKSGAKSSMHLPPLVFLPFE